MAKRKLRMLPPFESMPRQAKPKEYQGGITVPNHMTPTDLPEKPGDKEVTRSRRFPLLSLKRTESPESATAVGMAFFDPAYEMTSYPDYDHQDEQTGGIYCPPTWMDPEVFARMLLDKEEVVALARRVARGENKVNDRRALREQIEQVLLENYVEYLVERFQTVDDVLAEWLVAHVHDKDKYNPPRRKKRRKKPVETVVESPPVG